MLDAAGRAIKPGVTADEIDRVVHEVTAVITMSLCVYHHHHRLQLNEIAIHLLLIITSFQNPAVCE